MSMNKVTLLGRLTLDPELKEASSGSQTCQFSLATNESWTDKTEKRKRELSTTELSVGALLPQTASSI